MKTFAVLFFAAACAAHAGEKPVRVFVLAGQSNMVGQAESKDFPKEIRQQPRNVAVYDAGKPRDLWPAKGRVGPEASFALAMAKALPDEEILIVKYAVGGSSILSWSPNWSKEEADKAEDGGRGALYPKLIANVNAATESLKGRSFTFEGFFWMQGGRDGKYQAAADLYADRLKLFVETLRKDLKAPDLVFYCGVRSYDGKKIKFLKPVHDAQANLPNVVANTAAVNTDGLERGSDEVHLTAKGLTGLSERFADAYVKHAGKAAEEKKKAETKTEAK